MSKVFFETVGLKTIDVITSNLFDLWIETIAKLKEQGKSLFYIQLEIDTKLSEIYSLNEYEVRLIELSEKSESRLTPFKTDISELLRS